MLTFFTPFDVKMIQISTFPAAPSTERVPSLAERVASLRYSINLQLLNNRVPGLKNMAMLACLICQRTVKVDGLYHLQQIVVPDHSFSSWSIEKSYISILEIPTKKI